MDLNGLIELKELRKFLNGLIELKCRKRVKTV
jgi:hypothetical protein